MKVAYLFGSLNRGGAETLLLDVFRNSDKALFQFIGIHRKGGEYYDDFYSAGPRVIQCAPKRFGFFDYLWNLRKILLKEDVTIVHAQLSLDCIYARIATIGTNIRVLETLHGYDFGSNEVDKIINYISIKFADAICFVSQVQRDYYVKTYNIRNIAKTHVVYNGINFAKIDLALPSLDFVNQSQRIQLAMVGNFVRVRSQIVIVKSINCLRERGITHFDFYFIGKRVEQEKELYDDCVRYTEDNHLDNIHYLGSRGDVPTLLKSMDGFVYSTDHDTFGIAIVEAIAAGLPIVVNDWPVIQEICGEANDGIRYFKTGDAKDAADKIAELLSNIEKSKKVAAANALRVRKQYSIEKHIERLNEIYSNLLNRI